MKTNFLIKQFHKPGGFFGKIVGWSMSIKNKERSEWTIEKLKIKHSDRILEIG
jgi:hypothetical protein